MIEESEKDDSTNTGIRKEKTPGRIILKMYGKSRNSLFLFIICLSHLREHPKLVHHRAIGNLKKKNERNFWGWKPQKARKPIYLWTIPHHSFSDLQHMITINSRSHNFCDDLYCSATDSKMLSLDAFFPHVSWNFSLISGTGIQTKEVIEAEAAISTDKISFGLVRCGKWWNSIVIKDHCLISSKGFKKVEKFVQYSINPLI